jgi:hypothetical protein
MNPDWQQLDQELDRWHEAGLTLPLWWRDDDAVAPSPALDRLASLAQRLDFPVHLAVIPKDATKALADQVHTNPYLIPVVHGWAHFSHASPDDKKAEFGAHRSLAEMRAEAMQGLACLSDLFGPRLMPVFVPPWNRIAPQLVTELAGLGYLALSTFTPRLARLAAPGLVQVNTHLDPIAWKTGRGLVNPDTLINQIVRQLADRRTGQADNDEPYGILTHHLVHDDAIWGFTETLLTRLIAGPARRWAMSELTQKDTTT